MLPNGDRRVALPATDRQYHIDLAPGELLDGEGGYTVWGALSPARASVAARQLPIDPPRFLWFGRDDVQSPQLSNT